MDIGCCVEQAVISKTSETIKQKFAITNLILLAAMPEINRELGVDDVPGIEMIPR